jgi:hypothetical protein
MWNYLKNSRSFTSRQTTSPFGQTQGNWSPTGNNGFMGPGASTLPTYEQMNPSQQNFTTKPSQQNFTTKPPENGAVYGAPSNQNPYQTYVNQGTPNFNTGYQPPLGGLLGNAMALNQAYNDPQKGNNLAQQPIGGGLLNFAPNYQAGPVYGPSQSPAQPPAPSSSPMQKPRSPFSGRRFGRDW